MKGITMARNPDLFSALKELLEAYLRVIRAWSKPRKFWCFDNDDKQETNDDKQETVEMLLREHRDIAIRVDNARQALLKTNFNVPDNWLAIGVQPTIRYFRPDHQVKPSIPVSAADIEKRSHSAIRDASGAWEVVSEPLDPEPLTAVCREIDGVIQRLRADTELGNDKAKLADEAKADAESGRTAEPTDDSTPDVLNSFLGGKDLANALGVHPSRRDAFWRQLERKRLKLGDDNWHEVREPRPNSPRFLYREYSPRIRELAVAYTRPKPA